MNEHILLLKALANPTRLKLLKLLLQEELCVCELQELLQISQSAVSQQLATLKRIGVISERRDGMWTYYKGDVQRLQIGLSTFSNFLELEPATIPEMTAEVERRSTLNRAQICE